MLTDNQTTLDIKEASDAGVADLVISDIRSIDTINNPDEWQVDVKIFNLTENVTLWFHVENTVGFMDKMFIGIVAMCLLNFPLNHH